MILSRVTSRLTADWLKVYRYEPVLLQTFVEQKQFTGASYREAHWKHVGSTKGRGKRDRFKEAISRPSLDYRGRLQSQFMND